MTTKDTRFVFNPADDESVDAEYVLIGHPDVTIQVAPYAGGYCVNQYERDGKGDIVAMVDCGTFPTLAKAQAKALAVAGIRA